MIQPLQDIGIRDSPSHGRKAAVLGELAAAGFQVPCGYAATAECFDAFLRANGFPYRPSEYAAWSAEIRAALQRYTFSARFADEVSACVRRLRDAYPVDRLIVRTSALCEDRRSSSLAGVFCSFPGLDTCEQVLEAVRGCYLSVFSDGVLNRHAEGLIEADALKAGVILQRYVAGEVSGVTFTADTTGMDPRTVKISVVRGACSGITDGSAPAAIYVCDKESLEVKSSWGGPQILTPEVLRRLLESARGIERLSGYYQDIEWTLANGDLYILQARAITGFREVSAPSAWEIADDPSGSRRWTLRHDRCLPPLVGEIVSKCTDASGAGAYRYGMEWDSVQGAIVNGYLYESKREIPAAKERLEAYLRTLNEQFDRGTGEFAEHISPELSALVEGMERQYLDPRLPFPALRSYLDDAESFMVRSAELHWRATTSEWYLGHFFRRRLERFYDAISAQDLVDTVYGKSMMIAEREQLYELAAEVRASPALTELFSRYQFDSIVAARLERMDDPVALHLLDRMRGYGRRYGWLYGGSLEDGALYRGGEVSLRECAGRIRCYLHVDLDEYRRNVVAIQANAARLRRLGYGRCCSSADTELFETALKAGEKAFLAGDDHAYLICSKKYVYLCDALSKIGEAFAARGIIDAPDDVRFLTLAEIRGCFVGERGMRDAVRVRQESHATWSSMLPPKVLGGATGTPPDASPAGLEGTTRAIAVPVLRGESGTRKNARGRIHVGFPAGSAGDGLILLLDHGHEGDLTTVLGRVQGLILKMGTPACHMGIIARELGIPAVYGVGGEAAVLVDGDEVEIRGETGEVVLLAAASAPLRR
ncbi:MAG: PEP/pyruvate-binding domain-containing protein [Candidatus Latescibacterota bacterium]